jgi:hypothetical protein
MEEIICAGTVADFAQFIQALRFKDALFLAEEFPQRIISKPDERNKLLLFDLLDRVSDEERARFTSGRIFTKDAELRWEKTNGSNYSVVYFGPPIELEGMNKSRQELISTDHYEQQLKCYYLFGKRVDEKLRERLEIPAADISSAERLYAEARIPRLLHYPWTTQPTRKEERVQLEVLEYREKATDQITFYRFQGVKPAE